MAVSQHFVTFYSPGTFVAETSTHPIASWDVDEARRMMKTIVERYHAVPYGFMFTTRSRADDALDSEVSAKSPLHLVGGKIETREEIFARNDPDERILRDNMETNGIDRVHITTKGWRWTTPIRDDTILLDELEDQ